METPVAFAVSDTPRPNARTTGASAALRLGRRRTGQTLSIHWPRVIALGLNSLAWVAIVAIVRLIWRH
jgi:hypothetical protein